MQRPVVFAGVLLATLGGALTSAAPDRDLSVLYVGPDPAVEPKALWYTEEGQSSHRWKELVRERMPAFGKLLKEHFSEVKTIAVADYKPAMSAECDVTILDAMPEPLETRTVNGREQVIRLPEDFDRPTITISDVGPFMLGCRGPGWKFNHLCQCLNSHAHDFDPRHPIFTTPHAVKPTMHAVNVPLSYRCYASGRSLGDTMPMWRVQTEGFSDQKDFLSGCVIVPGLEDSPDCEAISRGECMKGRDSVAIARQGNFLHWGFVASPTFMTDEAKLAFVNAIHYISRFAGQRPLVHGEPWIPTRVDVDDMVYRLSDEGLAACNVWRAELDARCKVTVEKTRAKQERGDELTDHEKALLEVGFTEEPEYQRTDFLEYVVPATVRERFGDDWGKYVEYYGKHRGYLLAVPLEYAKYAMVVDEDARSLGIPNNDARLLGTCVELLERGEQPDLAQRVLERYTTEAFQTPAEWRQWLDENRERLFFTEVGGFTFMASPTARTNTRRSEAAGLGVSPPGLGDEHVRWTAEARRRVMDGGGTATIIVRAELSPGWHIYAKPAAAPYTATSLTLELPEGIMPIGQWQSPKAKADPLGSESWIYTGDVTFSHAIEVTPSVHGEQQIRIVVGYQACNELRCMQPMRKEIVVPFEADELPPSPIRTRR